MRVYTADAIRDALSLANRFDSEHEAEVALARFANDSDRDQRVIWLICMFAAERGYHDAALEASLKIQKDNALEGYSLVLRAFILVRKHDFSAAEQCLNMAIQGTCPDGDELGAVIALTRAALLFHRGKPALAYANLCEAFHLVREDHFLRGRILDSLGAYYAQQHDFYAAREFYLQALALKMGFDDQVGLALSHGQLGRLYMDWGNLDRALEHFIEDKDLCAQTGDKRGEAQIYNSIGQIYLAKRDWQGATEWLAEAVHRCDTGQWPVLAAYARKDYAFALLELGRAEEADPILIEAGKLFTEAGFEEGLAHVWRMNGKALTYKKRFEEAEVMLRRSIRWFQNNQELAQAARSQLQLTATMHACGVPSAMLSLDLAKALDWAERARRDLLVQEIEAELERIDPVKYRAHIYSRVRGRAVEADTSSLIAASLMPATVLFMDVQGSTEFSRNLDPGVVMITLNQMMSTFEPALAKQGAMVTTYMGDGFMALILGADHARRGVAAAMELITKVQQFNEPRKLLCLQTLNIRVGVGTGEVCVGNVGTYRKMDYTAIGTTVNLAARIQSEGEVGFPCICRATYEMARGYYDFKSSNPRVVKLKGLGDVEVWDVVGPAASARN